MSDTVLSLEHIKVDYGDFAAVEDVSLSVAEGSMVSIIGTNGSGKTTLLNAAAGLTAPSEGRIVLNGRDVTGMDAAKRVEEGLALVPQGGRCFGRMSVEDNLLAGSFSARARKKAGQSLERVYGLFPSLKDKRKQPAGTLSGGERQMTAIGRALMSEPSIMLFDELSLGLAPLVIKDIYEGLRRLNEEEQVTIVLVEQDTRRAMRMTDRTY
ncbi:MAG: ABC transporter ATP-binding protein, partial [Lachnospiraceae bacterium]|nr:ABC transporter ATP-binding protein [Lachnospiraceae bacterium]